MDTKQCKINSRYFWSLLEFLIFEYIYRISFPIYLKKKNEKNPSAYF